MTSLNVHVHIARITSEGKRHLLCLPRAGRDDDNDERRGGCETELFETHRCMLTTQNDDDEDDEVTSAEPTMLLLCLTGHIDRPFMQRWTHALDSRYGSFWNDATVYDTKAVCILALGYFGLCLPMALLLGYVLLLYFWGVEVGEQAGSMGVWQGSAVSILSLCFLRLYWHLALVHHFFSKVENRFAFNVNSKLATFFKQSTAYPMKSYADQVPHITISRLFIESHRITFTALCYHVPLEDALLIPTACEAIDTLRAKNNSRIFINIIVCVAPTGDGDDSRMQRLLAFFIASGFYAVLSGDGTVLVCVWGQKHQRNIELHYIHQQPHDHTNPYYTLLPLAFTVPSLTENELSSSAPIHEPPTAPNSGTKKKKKHCFAGPSDFLSPLLEIPPTSPSYLIQQTNHFPMWPFPVKARKKSGWRWWPSRRRRPYYNMIL